MPAAILETTFYAGRSGQDFDNPSAALSAGREEADGRLSYRWMRKDASGANCCVQRIQPAATNATACCWPWSARWAKACVWKLASVALIRKPSGRQRCASAERVTAVRAKNQWRLPGVPDATAYAAG